MSPGVSNCGCGPVYDIGCGRSQICAADFRTGIPKMTESVFAISKGIFLYLVDISLATMRCLRIRWEVDWMRCCRGQALDQPIILIPS